MIREQENQFKDDIQKIIKNNIHLFPDKYFGLNLSTEEEDTKLSFDMQFYSNVNISCRLRKYKYINYDDITIRSKSLKGNNSINNPTEFHKIKFLNMAQIYFYGWLNQDETEIIKWIIINIDEIRNDLHLGKNHINKDGTEFKTYDYDFLIERNAIINKIQKS